MRFGLGCVTKRQGRKISSECLLFLLYFLKDELKYIVWRKVNKFRSGSTTAASRWEEAGGSYLPEVKRCS